MNESELNEILQSDMRLWESAAHMKETKDSVTMVMDLPHGIGVTEVTLEGLTDATKRRDAVSAFGNHIRNIVENKIGDDAITSQAEYKRALAEPVEEPVVVIPDAPAMVAVISGPEAVAEQLELVKKQLLTLEDTRIKLTMELMGLQAYMEATNAPTDKGTPERTPASEDTEKV